jgi:AcrR family transcriptional regulator/DNA-binding MarR family transcriptional regulator
VVAVAARSEGRAVDRVDRVSPAAEAPGRPRVGEIQRARIVAAMGALVRERGAGGVSVAHVVARSGVSRRTFYELFDDREDCFVAAFDVAVARAAERVAPAYEAVGRWHERVRGALEAGLAFLDEEPELGYLCVVGALAGGPRALARRIQVVRELVEVVHEGRRESRATRRPSRLVAEGVVGAVLSVIHARLVEQSVAPTANGAASPSNGAASGTEPGVGSGKGSAAPRTSKPLVGLLNPLTGMIVLPYLGAAATERELRRPAPRTRKPVAPRTDPLSELHMRLTYRTVRVLLAIASQPDSSNRQVATAAGIADQGQISKLLARLYALGLIQNAGRDPAKGEPNAWSLTPRGHDVTHALQIQTG